MVQPVTTESPSEEPRRKPDGASPPAITAADDATRAGNSAQQTLLIPVICKDCGQGFDLPHNHFQPGVVSHCPHCRGSYVPTLPMYRAVRDAIRAFEAADTVDDSAKSAQLRARLAELTQQMRPAGKMVRRKGLAAMFT